LLFTRDQEEPVKTISNTEEIEEQEGYSSSEVGDDCHPNTPTYEGRKRG
jgi:hypothetical protein